VAGLGAAWPGTARPGTAWHGKGANGSFFLTFAKGSDMDTNGQKMKSISVRQERIDAAQVTSWELRYPALERLNAATLDKPTGTMFPRQQLWDICGGTDEFKKVCQRWSKCMMLIGKTVEFVMKERAYIIRPIDYVLKERHQKQLASSERRHRKEALRLALIPNDMIESDHEKRLRMFNMHQHNETAGKIEAQREQARIGVERPETLPQMGQ
jgi:uncharacterized protein YchJ